MRSVLGGLLIAVGIIAGGVIWLYTAYYFFATGQTGLGLIALLIPPADLVLPFLISPALGIASIASVGVLFVGSAIKGD